MTNNLLAAVGGPAPDSVINPVIGNLGNLSGEEFLSKAISIAITLMFIGGFVLFVFMFLIAGVQWIMSSGDKGAVEAARGRLINAVVGLFVLFLIFAFINLVEGIFGIQLLNITLPTLQNI